MANKWFIANTGQRYLISQYLSLTEGGSSGAGDATSADTINFSDTSGSTRTDLATGFATDTTVANCYTLPADTGGTDEYTNEHRTRENTFTVTGDYKFDAINLEFAADGDTIDVNGLFSMGANATFDNAQEGNIVSAGNVFIGDASIWLTNNYHSFTKDGNGTYENPNANNYWNNFTINSGITLTLSDIGRLTNRNSDSFVCNGILNVNSEIAYIGSDTTFTLGSSSNITNSGNIILDLLSTTTITQSQTGTFSFNGNLYSQVYDSEISILPAWDMRNATLYIDDAETLTTGGTIRLSSGTHRYKYYVIDTGIGSGENITIDHSTNNPDIYIYQNMNLETDGNLTYNKGTGTLYFVGSLNGQFDPASVDFEDNIEIEKGASNTLLMWELITVSTLTMKNGIVQWNIGGGGNNITTLTGTGGEFQSASSGNQATLNLTNSATVSDMTFKDIAMNSVNKINAKDNTNTNNGNTKGIVFEDSMGCGIGFF